MSEAFDEARGPAIDYKPPFDENTHTDKGIKGFVIGWTIVS